MGGCQSQDARNAAIDANFPADSRHVMMKVSSDKEMNEDAAQQGYKPRSASSGMSAIIERKRAEQQQSARTMTNSENEEDTTSASADPSAAAPKLERRGTEGTSTSIDLSSSISSRI